MSAAPQTPQDPIPRPPTDTPPHETARAVEDLIALSRTASRGLNHATSLDAEVDPGSLGEVDYWYRLGLRNAYAQAAGLLLAPALAEDAFTVAGRITTSLDAGVTDLEALRAAASGPHPAPASQAGLDWVGPRVFAARYGVVTDADRHYGSRWGTRSEQRITLRPNPVGDRGLLFVYDPTWDEYAVLATDVTAYAVQAAFTHATQVDIHLDPARFARLVHEHAADPALGAIPTRVAGPELGMQP